MGNKIGVIDYGSGNFSSVWNTLETFSQELQVIKTPDDFDICSHIILPGVGAFGACMHKLKNMQIIDPLNEVVLKQKKPFLGICVGMQVLAEYGTEFEKTAGLGWVKGIVDKLPIDQKQLPLPHMGWNDVENIQDSPLFHEVNADEPAFYFVHSYYFKLEQGVDQVYTFNYADNYTAGFSIENIHGVQFHPEKSQYNGVQLLKNFIAH